jgi:helix-turn-helix protein
MARAVSSPSPDRTTSATTFLMIWVDKYRRGGLNAEVDFVEKQRTYEAQIAALGRKIGQLTMEIDVLKKRRAISRPAMRIAGDVIARRHGVDHLRACGISAAEGCLVMTISRSTSYKRPDGAAAERRRLRDTAVRSAIENVLADWPCYGYRRVTHELRRRVITANHKKVARVMRHSALTPKRLKRFIATTDSDHGPASVSRSHQRIRSSRP